MRQRPPAQYAHVVSFRLTDEQAIHAEHLRASFEYQTWAEMGRWLFSDPRILAIMRDQIIDGGVERSIEGEFDPLGDPMEVDEFLDSLPEPDDPDHISEILEDLEGLDLL